jgi:hypothetical protein
MAYHAAQLEQEETASRPAMPVETVKTGKGLHYVEYGALPEKAHCRGEPNALGVYHLVRAFLSFLLTRPFVVHFRPLRFPVLAFRLAMIQIGAFCG